MSSCAWNCFFRDPGEDLLADFEEPAWLALCGRDNLRPVTFGLEGVGHREHYQAVLIRLKHDKKRPG